ncbi:MAG: sigma-70 family RNA polymerase sigma factor, partial [Solirubrobacterales bacterium]|nr:sigma-70 family RNA polymerase sigma factor [Solirubrobacterales bacterium]
MGAIWRTESARVIATLARAVGDVGLAEDLAQDAVVAALERWPRTGVPPNPGGWLTVTAKHRAIDLMRRSRTLQDKVAQLARELETTAPPDVEAELDDEIGDDVLSLVFTCCHPVLSLEARAALTLRMLGGLTTAEIARAYLVPEATLGQRISRAKRTLADAHVPFEVPSGDELRPRLAAVLEVVYLVFNEGYAATAGEDWVRADLLEEALRLGRLLAGLLPDEPEVHGLLALMELQASRRAARTGPGGEPVLLADQDRTRWDGA